MSEIIETTPTAIDAVVASSLIHEIRASADPIVTPELMVPVFPALGRGVWSLPQVRDLVVLTWTLNGRNHAPASRFLEAADAIIKHRRDRPNLKAAAAARARAAKRAASGEAA